MVIAESNFVGPLVSIKKQIVEIDNLKTFFLTLASLADGQEGAGEGAFIQMPPQMAYNIGIKLDSLIDRIFYELSPNFAADREARRGKAPADNPSEAQSIPEAH